MTRLEVTGTAVEGGGPALGLTQIDAVQAGIAAVTPSLGSATVRSMAYPDADAAREAHESELVKLTGSFTVTNSFNTNSFGEIGLAKGSGPLLQPTDVGAPNSVAAEAQAVQNAARGVVLDDGGERQLQLGRTRRRRCHG